MGRVSEKLVQLKDSLVIKDRTAFIELTRGLIEECVEPVHLIEKGFRAGMEEGKKI